MDAQSTHDIPTTGGFRAGPRKGGLLALVLASALTLTGCGDDHPVGPEGGGDDPPDQVSTSQLSFLQQAQNAPPFFQFDGDTTFVATAGQDLEVEIFYQDEEDPGQRGDKYLEFELDDASLARYPEDHPRKAGAAFQPGDTVHITLSVTSDTLLADFGPSGLQFSPDEPAELEIRFQNADPDFDDDGEEDPELETEIDIWRQETSGGDWFRDGALKDFEGDRIRALVESFTRWAVAI